jgi:D-alanyl-D-alanine carboxypeptidase
MGSRCVSVRYGRAPVLVCLAGLAASFLLTLSSPAEARRRQRTGGYNPPFAAMVVDAKTGRTLHAQNEDALRHPASITKVMTLYLLFEQLERGKVTLSTPFRVSANAARQAPSKLSLDPGETIEVDDAIKALVTKSANDVAVVIAENLAGSEEAFAAEMTRKARALGMSRTVYRNASGLPDPEQVTSARDLTILARAIQDRFPKYYRYFQTRVFNYAGSAHRNHNKLLGRVEGVDGIKTGFTRASGFNLMTNVKTDDRHIVAVILGGRSGASRDQTMAALVRSNLPRAYAGARQAPLVAEAADRPRPVMVAEAPPGPAGGGGRPAPAPAASRRDQCRDDGDSDGAGSGQFRDRRHRHGPEGPGSLGSQYHAAGLRLGLRGYLDHDAEHRPLEAEPSGLAAHGASLRGPPRS